MSIWNTANRARACRVCVACLAGCALVVLSASFAGAEYGPRTTIGKNYQQTSDTTSVDGIASGNCSDSLSCYVLFQRAPQQKALIVQYVSCIVTASTGEIRIGILVTRKGQTFPLRHTNLAPVRTTGGTWAVNSPVMHLLKSGERAVVRFINSTAATWGATCNISGKLVKP